MLLSFNSAIAQNKSITQFAIWKPKEGLEKNFEKGYKQHLKWHKTNGDTWNWYGWSFTSGVRAGWFIDATDNHSWKDFDNSIKPGEDWADNEFHVLPFADFQTVFKVSMLKEISMADSNSLKSKYLRMVTINVNDVPNAVKVVEQLKMHYQEKSFTKHFIVYKMIDGGDVNQLLLFIGFSSMDEFGKTENLQEEITAIETSLKTKSIISLISETLVYREDMSLFSR